MNTAGIYDMASGRKPSPDEQAKELAIKQQEAADKRAVYAEWLNRPVTKEFLLSVLAEANELDSQARELALAAQDTINTQQIINRLVQSATLRKVIDNAQKLAS